MDNNARGTKQIIDNVLPNMQGGNGIPNQNNITGSMATGQNSSYVVPNMSQDNGQTSSSAIPGQPSEIFYDKNGQASYNRPDNSQDNLPPTTSNEIPYYQSQLVNNQNEPLDKDEIKRAQKKEAKKKEREDAKVTGEAMATVGVAAAGYFGGPTAGKWAARAKKYSLLSKAGHYHYGKKINKRVPGAAEIARLGKNLGLYDAVDSVAGGGLASKKSGASIKNAAKSVLQNSKAGAIKKDSASVGKAGGNGKLDNIKSALGNNSFSNIGKSGSAKNSKNTGIISGFFNKNSKSFFKKYKFIIIGVGAFFFIILAIFMGGVSGHSSYGSSAISSVSEGKDAGEYFKEFYEICESDKELCSDEYLSMIESQKAFFEELDKVGKSYNLSDKQKLMILETITYGYDIDDIELGKTFVIDENNETSETDNVYDEEKNTIGFLAEKFNGSDDNYYNYLITEAYFDDRPNCINDFAKYARNAGLESISSLSDSDREIVRGKIVSQIKSNVNSQYPEKEFNNNTKTITVSSNSSFWWPIGSTVKTFLNIHNKLLEFANGLPAFTGISSKFGNRYHPITGKYKLHDGIDIPATIGTPVIASQSGTVIAVTNSCATTNSNGCGGGYGNSIKIKTYYSKTNLYAHLSKDSVTVKVGDEVEQGQVIGSVGSSGNSTGPHLHYSVITANGDFDNPLDYVDPNNPRGISDYENAKRFLYLNENDCQDDNVVHCGLDGLATSKYGMLLKWQYDKFNNFGYPISSKNGTYKEYCNKELPGDVTYKVMDALIKEYVNNYIKPRAVKKGWTFTDYQMDALISLAWSGPSVLYGFFNAENGYNKYGATEELCTKWWNTYANSSQAALDQGYDVTKGLTNRRTRECHLFVYGDYGDAATDRCILNIGG